MKHTILSLFSLAANAFVGQEAKHPCSDTRTVQTSTGTFTGLIDPEFPNTRQFRSIPFANPPVRERRWLAPEKLSPSDEHFNSTEFPMSCAQYVSAVENFYNSNLTRGNTIYNFPDNDTSGRVGADSSEDCLYLAIWTPKIVPKEGLPVLFFMTGGGFTMGGVNIPWQLPPSWVERTQEHIVVTINYRLAIFGFPNARGLANSDQNLAILDQRLALEWVRDNIAAFGGDPSRITQMGRSAGAVSLDVHAYAFYDDPIAQAHYLQSGTIFGSTIYPKDPTYSNFSYVARHFDCGDDEDADGTAELECMRQISYQDLTNFIGQYTDAGVSPPLYFTLVPDDLIVFTNYTERSEAGQIARVPVIISNTANEGSGVVAWPPADPVNGPGQEQITAADVAVMVCPAYNATVYRNRLGADVPVFRWQHAGQFPNLNYYSWMGAWHASDIPITFGTYHAMDYVADTTPFEIDVSNSMQDHLLAFMKEPYHGPQNTLGWQPMNAISDPNGGDLIRFGADGLVSQHVNGVDVDGVCQGIGEYNPFP